MKPRKVRLHEKRVGPAMPDEYERGVIAAYLAADRLRLLAHVAELEAHQDEPGGEWCRAQAAYFKHACAYLKHLIERMKGTGRRKKSPPAE